MTETRAHDLLNQPLLSLVDAEGRRQRASLAEVLARLGEGEEIEFAKLQAHQQHAWHAFLVQLAAMVAHRRGEPRLDLPPDEWARCLADLAGEGGDDAWHLWVEDVSRPAFFQTPAPEGDLSAYKDPEPCPDAVDVVPTSRDHDVKQRKMLRPEPEDWAYALLSVQTMEGYYGVGNYGILRMNGGFSSRPGVGVAPGFGWAARFRRDVALAGEMRPSTIESFGYRDEGGLTLLWTLPWDGRKGSARSPSACDPWFVEVCRRLRLVRDAEGRLAVWRANSEEAFLASGESTGDTGDPWTPVSAEGKGLTVQAGGFHYRLLSDLLLSGNYPQRPALEVRRADGESALLIAQVLARGQGKTGGYHQRFLDLGPRVRGWLREPSERERLAALAGDRVERTRTAQRRVLHPALCCLLQGGRESLNFKDERTGRWLDALDRAADGVFFAALWRDAELAPADADRRWQCWLYEEAERQLDDAVGAAPVSAADRPRAVARARLLLRGVARKHLPAAFATSDDQKGGNDGAEPGTSHATA